MSAIIAEFTRFGKKGNFVQIGGENTESTAVVNSQGVQRRRGFDRREMM